MTLARIMSDAQTIRAEQAEAAALTSLMAAPPPAVAASLGISVHVEGDAVAAFVASVDALSLNRVVGLGVTTPATEENIDRIIAAAADRGVKRFFVQLAPTAGPADLRAWLQARGAVPYNRWVRLWRSTATPLAAVAPTRLHIGRVTPAEALPFARIVRTGFGMPETLDPWLAATVGRPGWQHYAAWDGPDMVATGALFVWRRSAWFGLAATLEQYRGCGAQSALISRRFADAAALGCDWIVAETAEQRPDRPAPSYRNLLRLGFAEAYFRDNLVLAPQASSASSLVAGAPGWAPPRLPADGGR